jgi:hypothetical protein
MAWEVTSSLYSLDLPPFDFLPGEKERFYAVTESVKQEYYARSGRFGAVPTGGADAVPKGHPYYVWGSENFSLDEGFRYPVIDPPIRLRLKTVRKKLPAIMAVSIGHCIGQEMIAAIESIEPGVHQYLPLDVLQKDGTPLPEPRYLLNVCTRLDTVDPERSDLHVCEVTGKYLGFRSSKTKPSFQKDKVRGHALWWDYRVSCLLMSDALADIIKANGFRGWDLQYHYPEV